MNKQEIFPVRLEKKNGNHGGLKIPPRPRKIEKKSAGEEETSTLKKRKTRKKNGKKRTVFNILKTAAGELLLSGSYSCRDFEMPEQITMELKVDDIIAGRKTSIHHWLFVSDLRLKLGIVCPEFTVLEMEKQVTIGDIVNSVWRKLSDKDKEHLLAEGKIIIRVLKKEGEEIREERKKNLKAAEKAASEANSLENQAVKTAG